MCVIIDDVVGGVLGLLTVTRIIHSKLPESNYLHPFPDVPTPYTLHMYLLHSMLCMSPYIDTGNTDNVPHFRRLAVGTVRRQYFGSLHYAIKCTVLKRQPSHTCVLRH